MKNLFRLLARRIQTRAISTSRRRFRRRDRLWVAGETLEARTLLSAPAAIDDSVQTAVNTPVSIVPLANDSDPDGDVLSVASVAGATNGSITQNGNTLVYTPTSGFVGSDTLSYVASDGTGGTATGSIVVTVNPSVTSTLGLPFGQHVPYAPGTIAPNNRTQVQLDDDIRAFYNTWKSRYIVSAGTSAAGIPMYREAWGGDPSKTVSEGMGFAMVIVPLMAGQDPDAQKIFDGLWEFARSHPSGIDGRLMTWKVPVGSDGNDSAFDGDADMAYGMLLADRQWGSNGRVNYKAEAQKLIGAIYASTIGPDSHLPELGDWVTANGSPYNQYTVRTSDFMTATFRAYARATGDARWNTVVSSVQSAINSIQANYSANTGLLPDFIVPTSSTNHTPKPAAANFLESSNDGNYYYNAGRDPWRIAADALLYNDAASLAEARKISTWIQGATGGNPANIKAGYTLSGSPVSGSSYFTTFFAAPLGVAAMTNPAQQNWLNAIYAAVYNRYEGEYEDSVNLLSMLLMTRNYWDPTSPNNAYPLANGQALTTGQNTPVTANLLAGAFDSDGNPLSLIGVSRGTHGTTSVAPDGRVIYTPNAGYLGNDAFNYSISDGHGGTATGVVNVVVTGVSTAGDPPSANAGGPYSGSEGSAIMFAGGGTSPGGGSLTYQWDFEYNGTFQADASGVGLTTPSHAYADNGTYTAALRVVDPSNVASAISTAQVVVSNVAPTATLSGSYSGSVGTAITFSGSATDPGADTLTYQWDFDYNGTFAADSSGVNLKNPSHTYTTAGTYTVALRVVDDDSGVSAIRTASVSVAPAIPASGVKDIRISSVADDAEQNTQNGQTSLSSTVLNMTRNGTTSQIVGLRFKTVDIPKGATIVNAYVQFTASGTSTAQTSLTIKGQAIDDAPAFTTSAYNLRNRTSTSASASWSPPAWTVSGQAGTNQRTPNLAAVLQQIVNRAGWSSGNSLVLLITGSGQRNAFAYNVGSSSAAPLLHIEWQMPAALTASAIAPASARESGAAAGLADASIEAIANAAIARWAQAGLNAQQLAELGQVEFRVADLDGAKLAVASGHTVTIDIDAAGWGWFVDPTPADDSEFGSDGMALEASGAAFNMDLLTVIAHEFGHVIGLSHDLDDATLQSQSGADRVMDPLLDPGEREVPTAVDLDALYADSNALSSVLHHDGRSHRHAPRQP